MTNYIELNKTKIPQRMVKSIVLEDVNSFCDLDFQDQMKVEKLVLGAVGNPTPFDADEIEFHIPSFCRARMEITIYADEKTNAVELCSYFLNHIGDSGANLKIYDSTGREIDITATDATDTLVYKKKYQPHFSLTEDESQEVIIVEKNNRTPDEITDLAVLTTTMKEANMVKFNDPVAAVVEIAEEDITIAAELGATSIPAGTKYFYFPALTESPEGIYNVYVFSTDGETWEFSVNLT